MASETDKRIERRETAAKIRGEQLFENLRGGRVDRPSTTGTRIAALVVAVAIHISTIAIFCLGFFVLITNLGQFFGYVVGIPLMLLGFLLRPRLGGIKSGTVVLPKEQAPRLYGLTNTIGQAIGAKPVDLIALDASFNASHSQVGLRRRRILWIGLSLWNVLGDYERVALLSHELAHQVNGDLSYGLVVGSALRTLDQWLAVLRAPRWRQGSGSLFEALEAAGALLARLAMRLMRYVVLAIAWLERTLLFQSQQRAEYFADMLAARIGSTDAMVRCLDVLHLARPCSQAVVYAARREEPDVWAAEHRFFQEITPSEWERLRRLHSMRGTGIDTTHPPTNLRIDLLRSRPTEPGIVELEGDEARAIAAEIASGFELVGQQLASRFAV